MFQNSRETCYFEKETLIGNHARFVSKELTKVIYTRTRFRYKYLKNLDEIKLYNEKNCTGRSETSVSPFEENQIFFF